MNNLACWRCQTIIDQAQTFCVCLHNGFPTPLRFGKYRVIDSLGRGSFGAVYKCLDPDVDRFVAVKKLYPNAQAVTGELSRIRASGALVHTNIVRVFDVNRDEGTIVMEFAAGGTLTDKMDSDPSWVHANYVKLALQICDALRAAHSENIIHRDIKPDNILLTEDGSVKVADFGVCAILSTLDYTNGIAGTPPYMAPEVLEGLNYNTDADVHSLGCMMYEMWTGHLPWETSGGLASYLAVKSRQQPVAMREATGIPTSDLLNDLVARMITGTQRRITTVDLVTQHLLVVDGRKADGVRTIDDIHGSLLVLYGYANVDTNPLELLHQCNIGFRALAGPLRRSDESQTLTMRRFVKQFSWISAFIASINLRPSQLIWLKYDGSCPYCLSEICNCPEANQPSQSERNEVLLGRMRGRWAEAAPPPKTFQEYQATFQRIFGSRNERAGILEAFVHAHHEVAEAADAVIHLSLTEPDRLLALHLEASDVISWFYALLNLYDPDADFVAAFDNLYANGCYACSANPCRCPEPLGVEDWRHALKMVPHYEQ